MRASSSMSRILVPDKAMGTPWCWTEFNRSPGAGVTSACNRMFLRASPETSFYKTAGPRNKPFTSLFYRASPDSGPLGVSNMQLDLFAELRALQRHALVTLQERCRET